MQEMSSWLKKLREEFGIIAIKAEFEAEGSRKNELIMLNEVVFRNGLKTFIKIGGCEAVNDLYECRLLGAGGIMAPMIESPFAMKKFCSAINQAYPTDEQAELEFIINAETVSAQKVFDDILLAGKGKVGAIAIGRTDLTASAELPGDAINGDTIFQLCQSFAQSAKKHNYIVGVGGKITLAAVPFLQKMGDIVDRFETRKVVFDYHNCKNRMSDAIFAALNFEYLYMLNKAEYYGEMAKEDESRLVNFKKMIDSFKK